MRREGEDLGCEPRSQAVAGEAAPELGVSPEFSVDQLAHSPWIDPASVIRSCVEPGLLMEREPGDVASDDRLSW